MDIATRLERHPLDSERNYKGGASYQDFSFRRLCCDEQRFLSLHGHADPVSPESLPDHDLPNGKTHASRVAESGVWGDSGFGQQVLGHGSGEDPRVTSIEEGGVTDIPRQNCLRGQESSGSQKFTVMDPRANYHITDRRHGMRTERLQPCQSPGAFWNSGLMPASPSL